VSPPGAAGTAVGVVVVLGALELEDDVVAAAALELVATLEPLPQADNASVAYTQQLELNFRISCPMADRGDTVAQCGP
jgi:hypothetical protein